MDSRFDAKTARRWRTAAVPSWLYRWLLPAAWAIALLVSFNSDDRPCSPADPSICGPDKRLSIALVLCVAAVLTQWIVPALGWMLGIAFAALGLRYDDVPEARLSWAVFGALCAVLLVPGGRSRCPASAVSTRVWSGSRSTPAHRLGPG